MDLATLKAQEETLIFDHFNEETALTLGMRLHAMGGRCTIAHRHLNSVTTTLLVSPFAFWGRGH